MQINPWIIPGIKQITPRSDEEIKTSILQAVEQVTGYSLNMLLKNNRTRDRVLARNLCYYFLRKHTRYSLKQIGDLFNKDHTTIIHGIRMVNDMLTTNDNATKHWYQSIQLIFKQLI